MMKATLLKGKEEAFSDSFHLLNGGGKPDNQA